MLIVYAGLFLILFCLAFYAGKKVADGYYEKMIAEMQYQLRLTAAQNGVGYVASPPAKKRVPIGQPFMDKLKQNGRATQQISPSNF